MSKPKILLLISFVMVFCAGVSIGAFVRGSRSGHHEPTWLADELGLTSDQQREMKEIWEPVRNNAREYPSQQRRELSEKRDRAVRELLHEDQVGRFDEIVATYKREKEELIKEWRAPFEEAMGKTKRMLSDEQFRKFEELGKKKKGHDWNQNPRSSESGTVKKDGTDARRD